jgi:hypothetical protein
MALVLGPVQDPVDGSNNQPLFSIAHPDSGASFSGTIAAGTRAMSV